MFSPERCWTWAKWGFLALALLGGFSWFFGPLCTMGIPPLPPNVELPLGGLLNAAADSDGNIYCAAPSHGRIQKYDRHGQFQRAWLVPGGDGFVWVDVDKRDRVHLLVFRGQPRWFVFDQEGNRVDGAPQDLDPSSPLLAESEGREVESYTKPPYAIRNRWIYPSVVKMDAAGNEHTVVSTPWYLWPFMAPVPAMLEIIVGVLGLLISKGVLEIVYGAASLRPDVSEQE